MDHLINLSQSEHIGVACIYFNHKETHIHTLDNLLAGLWRQLVWKKPLGSASELYRQHIEKKTRPPYEDIQKLLSSAFIEFTQAYIILDGIDEYPEREWHSLAKTLTEMQPKTNLLVMSRPHIAPTKLLSNLVTLEIKANHRDIQAYVDAQMQNSSRLSQHIAAKPGLHRDILSKICNSVDGM
jgi:hypothetical protein